MGLTDWTGLSRAIHRWLPSQCILCHAWPAQTLCSACRLRFARATARCLQCAQRVPQGILRCSACLRHPTPLESCVAAVDYAWPWADVVTQFKFQARPDLAYALAALLQEADGAQALLAQADVLLPIPLARDRLRERGYNQALLLARALCPQKTHAQWLLRTHTTPAQSSLGRAQRLRNLHGAFALQPSAQTTLKGARVLLIDDVMTTGATLQTAAEMLHAQGAAHTSALVLARTPAPGA